MGKKKQKKTTSWYSGCKELPNHEFAFIGRGRLGMYDACYTVRAPLDLVLICFLLQRFGEASTWASDPCSPSCACGQTRRFGEFTT